MNRSKLRRRFRFSPRQRAEAVRLVLEEGVPKNAVAKQFRTSWGVVDYWVKKSGAAGTAASRPSAPEPEDTAPVETFTLPECSFESVPEPDLQPSTTSSSTGTSISADERLFFQQRIQSLRDERDFLRAMVSHLIGLPSAAAGLDLDYSA